MNSHASPLPSAMKTDAIEEVFRAFALYVNLADHERDAKMLAAARSALADLRRRCADLEILLRAALPPEDEAAPFMTHGEGCDGTPSYWLHRNADDLDPFVLDEVNGLPALPLTDDARSALGAERGKG